MTEIEAVVKDGVIVPLVPLKGYDGKRVRIRIVVDDDRWEKEYAYGRLLKEGDDAEELFEF